MCFCQLFFLGTTLPQEIRFKHLNLNGLNISIHSRYSARLLYQALFPEIFNHNMLYVYGFIIT